jgi:hypothetical protein
VRRLKPPQGPVARYRCHTATFGCSRLFGEGEYNHQVGACHACCRQAAQRWRIKVTELSFLSVAWSAAKADAGGVEPHAQDVVRMLEKMGIHPEPPPDWVLPEADRISAG